MAYSKPIAIAALAGSFAVASSAALAGERVPTSELPEAVVNTVQAKLPGAQITHAEWDDKRTGYELHVTHEGKVYEVEVKQDGTLKELELETR